ncbi:MAG: hypothetical protein GX616_24855, partial [Planctomycetes bacterium]|nr:hypothetical protein [Planctomycetota bacterium]
LDNTYPAPPCTTEHYYYYYYDGVRRIQTVDDNATPANAADDLTEHEYVYGPEYVDEFVLESHKSGGAQQDFYVLQDANFNVMALTDAGGGVVEQYQWEPYGLLAAKDTDTGGTIPHSHIGHQGLFFYRFNPQTGDTATLSTTAIGLYFNRNRWYSPSLGRFTSRDPNETAVLILTAVAARGHTLSATVGAFDTVGHFRDGMSLYLGLRSNPITNRDPAGAFSLAELGMASGVQGLIGGIVSGAVNKMLGGSFWQGAGAGFVGGLLGGAAGGLVNSAFLGSTTGLFGTLAARVATGAADGFVSGYAESVMLNGNDFGTNLADALFCSAIGGATGGLFEVGGMLTQGALYRIGRHLTFKTGDAARDFLLSMVGGKSEVWIARLKRIVDVLAPDQIAHESKMGHQAYCDLLIRQAEKDAELVAKSGGDVKGVHWHFFRSGNTRKVGGDGRLLALLKQLGIPYTIYE